jgi:ribonuclease Z
MSLSLRFLGTSASRPTVERNVSSVALVREGETLLFDCGEGTQRQMMRYGVSFALRDIFFTHFHADHVLGVIGLMRTMALQGRTDALHLYGPRGAGKVLRRAEGFGVERLGFPVEITEVINDAPIRRHEYAIVPFVADHGGGPALGYALVEDDRKGRFHPERARELGIPEGPLWGQIHRGLPVTLPDGRIVQPSELVGPPRHGRRIAITGDTRPCPSTVEVARDADLLVHEATFAEEEAARAIETGHSTAREAAEIAVQAGAKRLVLTHLSARYSRDSRDLEREARAVFPDVTIARDGMEIEIAYEREAGEDAEGGVDTAPGKRQGTG